MGKNSKRKIKLRRRLLAALDLPEETAGTPKLTVLGCEHALVENHTGICQYREEEICLYTRQGRLWVRGRGLALLEVSSERLYITGELVQISME